MFIARGRLPTKKFNDVIPQLTRLISDWRPKKKNGIGDRKRKKSTTVELTVTQFALTALGGPKH